ncbi:MULTISPECIES: homoserine kinase [unclassified Polaribacter]|uniref:homoserine kinase n=1 Tax=unclassified Polaribacter TaxID=196858 RepID=UPI0011BFBD90|nr:MULTISPECIES: homoserine kinase [unclassified Polaribacter]TXD53418.1 homoserine kinase [Polaribacter sp. IC063]TXD61480.1 homoserine kinase [Polaribacter sp. IC066]
MDYLKIFSPATVANVSCGFDSLGFAVDAVGDEMTFTKTAEKGVKIMKITGAALTYNVDKNAASAVVKKMLLKANADFGLALTIHKGFTPGSGLGSSAASAAGAAFGVNQFLENKYSELELTKFAMFGEEIACGSAIADNVAAAIYGGFVLVRSYEPLEIIKLPVPSALRVVAIHPQIEVKTKDAREVLPAEIPLKDAVIQWANVGGLISGLYTDNYNLISNSLVDIIVEPYRKKLIPFFDIVKTSAISAGALGAGISGSGPTIFALCKGDEIANNVYKAIDESYKNTGIKFEMFISKVNSKGMKIIERT